MSGRFRSPGSRGSLHPQPHRRCRFHLSLWQLSADFHLVSPLFLPGPDGFAAVEPRLIEVSRALGLSRWSVVWKIALPNAMPDILAGMRIGLTVSLILTVVGKMLGSRDGLGFAILLAGRSFHSADVFAGVILFGIIGYISGQLMSLAEWRLLRWRRPS